VSLFGGAIRVLFLKESPAWGWGRRQQCKFSDKNHPLIFSSEYGIARASSDRVASLPLGQEASVIG
jgi:hypothetical protein